MSYEAWRATFQSSEQAARAAYQELQAARAQSGQGVEPADGQWLIQMRGDYLVTRGVWECPDHRGYTNDINEAGRYSEEEAKEAERMMPEKCKAVRLPTARAQSGQGVEPVAWLLLFASNEVHDVAYSKEQRNKWLRDAGRKAVPLYTQPQPAQEGWRLRILSEFPLLDDDGLDQEKHHCEWSIQQDRKRLHSVLYTTPHPEGDGWIKCGERLPKLGQRVQLFSQGVIQHMMPLFDASDEGPFWDFEVHDYNPPVDVSRDQWRPLPQPPKEGSGNE